MPALKGENTSWESRCVNKCALHVRGVVEAAGTEAAVCTEGAENNWQEEVRNEAGGEAGREARVLNVGLKVQNLSRRPGVGKLQPSGQI